MQRLPFRPRLAKNACNMWKKGNVCNSNPNAGLATICAVWQLWENVPTHSRLWPCELQSSRKETVCWCLLRLLKWKVKVLKRQAKTALLTLPACWLHSINNLSHSHLRAHVAHATHLEIKATQGSKGISQYLSLMWKQRLPSRPRLAKNSCTMWKKGSLLWEDKEESACFDVAIERFPTHRNSTPKF